jgi:hypothetical protein
MISGLDRAKTVPSAHCTMTVPTDSPLTGSISLARRFSFSRASRFICNFICEYFFEDLRVSLAKPLSHPFISHASSTQPRGIRGTKVVDSEIGNLGPPKSLVPNRLERGLVPASIQIARKQERTIPRAGHLSTKGFNG